MKIRPQPPRTVIYARDMSEDGPEQINLDGKPRPRELRKIIKNAKRIPRPFDVLLVASMPVLGTPTQVQKIISELDALGIKIATANGSTH